MTQHPTSRARAVVFTDLDGTLLDHDSYAWTAAAPALDALKQAGVPLVLASSKTAAEIAALHAELGLGRTPAIVKKGAGLWRPGAGPDDTGADANQDASAYRRLRKRPEPVLSNQCPNGCYRPIDRVCPHKVMQYRQDRLQSHRSQ